MKVKFFFSILFFFYKVTYSQNNQWNIDTKNSVIIYSGDHLLHSWKGKNDKVYGLAIPNSSEDSLEKLAILIYVRDFDSNNPGRDAHSLEVLEELKYPEIKFYSEIIEITGNQLKMFGRFDFHGIKIEKELFAQVEMRNLEWQISGNFQLTPTDFNIELPSFLSVKMEDLLEIEYQIVISK